jgi:hypothetical protein
MDWGGEGEDELSRVGIKGERKFQASVSRWQQQEDVLLCCGDRFYRKLWKTREVANKWENSEDVGTVTKECEGSDD